MTVPIAYSSCSGVLLEALKHRDCYHELRGCRCTGPVCHVYPEGVFVCSEQALLGGEPVAALFQNPIKCTVALNGPFKGKGQCLAQGQTQKRLLKNVLEMEQSVFGGKQIRSDLSFQPAQHLFFNYILILFFFTTPCLKALYVCAMHAGIYVFIGGHVCVHSCVFFYMYVYLCSNMHRYYLYQRPMGRPSSNFFMGTRLERMCV